MFSIINQLVNNPKKKSIMKTIKFILILILFSFIHMAISQNQTLPDVELYTLDGVPVSATEITNNDKPMVMVFWKSNVKECCSQLSMINEIYVDEFKDKGVKVVAICVDCVGAIQHIKPFVYGNNLDIEVLIDKNGDFKRSMCVSSVPYTILFDQKMKAYCKYVGYCHNGEDFL